LQRIENQFQNRKASSGLQAIQGSPNYPKQLAEILFSKVFQGSKKGGHHDSALVARILGPKKPLQVCGEPAAEAGSGSPPSGGHQDPGPIPRMEEPAHHSRSQQIAQEAGVRRRGSAQLRGLQAAPPAPHLRDSRCIFAQELKVSMPI